MYTIFESPDVAPPDKTSAPGPVPTAVKAKNLYDARETNLRHADAVDESEWLAEDLLSESEAAEVEVVVAEYSNGFVYIVEILAIIIIRGLIFNVVRRRQLIDRSACFICVS